MDFNEAIEFVNKVKVRSRVCLQWCCKYRKVISTMSAGCCTTLVRSGSSTSGCGGGRNTAIQHQAAASHAQTCCVGAVLRDHNRAVSSESLRVQAVRGMQARGLGDESFYNSFLAALSAYSEVQKTIVETYEEVRWYWLGFCCLG